MQGSAHIAVSDFERSIGFYTAIFGQEPAVRTHDFASWRLKDSHIMFAITVRRSAPSRSAQAALMGHFSFPQ